MASTPRKNPGPKPDHVVIEHNLHSQTDEGELVLDLRLPVDRLELLMDMEDLDLPDKKIPRWLRENVLSDDDRAKIEGLKDGARGYAILMRYAQEVGLRLGASLGESQGSTDASESTEQPSEPTSGSATD